MTDIRFMGDNLYIEYWRSVLPSIIEQFKTGNQTVQLKVKGLSAYGERQSYYANFRIVNGVLDIPKNAYAQGRDLHQVLVADEYFKQHLANSTIQITITKDLILKMEILEPTAPDFFSEEDFEQLQKFAGKNKVAGNEEHQQVYDYLRGTYAKIAFWARQVNQKLFPQGKVHLVQKPTNQANNFEHYQWAKIFPDKQAADSGELAYTVTIDTDYQFIVKIDTVGLAESDERRQKYLQVRGEYTSSAIVKILPADQVLDKGWKYIIDLSANIITSLQPDFDKLLQLLAGTEQPVQANEPAPKIDRPLNTILYGPPGTGKTYHTIDKAVAIANPGFAIDTSSREEIKKEYERLKNEKQITFVTFHQSMSYEDFIEGIKPDAGSGEGTVNYAVQDGIFKTACQLAVQGGSIADNFDAVYDRLLQEIEDNDNALVLKTLKRNKEFTIYQNSKGNLRFHANTEKAYEGVITKEYVSIYLRTGEAIDWPSYTKSVGEYLKSKFGYRPGVTSKNKNFVLIIDEINRGNVSQIFGELITLIEDDKRTGQAEALSTILPYSKKPFAVPSNLFIIGTMNTADRSVEALDTALRRRFSFEVMLPDATKITESPEGIDLPQLLTTINTRLEALLTKDHTIGHAWLMKTDTIEKLQLAFKNKILPLLQEFFFNDYAKIGLVLGKAFVETKTVGSAFAKFDDELAADFADKTIYSLKDPLTLQPEDFISIYK